MKNIWSSFKDAESAVNAIFSALQTGVVIIDAKEHNIVDINEAAIKMIGLPKEQVIGKICHSFICPAERGKCPITDLKQTVDESERSLIRGDGTSLPILKSVKNIFIDKKEYLIESFVDISKLKDIENTKDEIDAELKKRLGELERFQKVTLGREDRIMELKAEVNRLKALVGEK